MRKAFVDEVLADTPDPRITAAVGIKDRILEIALEKVPKKVMDLWKNHETRPFIQCSNESALSFADFPGRWGDSRFLVEFPSDHGITRHEFRGDKQIQRLAATIDSANDQRRELKSQLVGLIAGFTTIKAAKAGLPEFEKYLPIETEAPTYAVAVQAANVVAKLNEAGWPQGEPNE
jgi:hypothetical protein